MKVRVKKKKKKGKARVLRVFACAFKYTWLKISFFKIYLDFRKVFHTVAL